MVYALPVILVVIIGLLAGVMLTVASKVMYVPVDETAGKLRECLPGANCGACGFAGCDDYAAELAADHELATNLCPPGGEATAIALAEVLGVEYAGAVEKFAVIRCSGTMEKTNFVMDYKGWASCAANKIFYKGRGMCQRSCLALGDCERACPEGAIRMENGVADVDKKRCTGCGICAKTCPNNLIEVIYAKTRVFVGCMSEDAAKDTKENCDVGCVACGLCVKSCKFEAVSVANNVAVIDYEKCKNCGICVKACPRNIIVMLPKRSAPAKHKAPAV